MKRTLTALCLMVATLTACAVTDVGNPQDEEFEATVAFALLNNEGNADTTPYRIDGAWFVFERIRLIESNDCTNDAAVDLDGPVVVSLDNTKPIWETPSFTQKRGDFCRVGMLLNPTLDDVPAGAPETLKQRSIVIKGTRTSDETPFEIRATLDDKLKIDALMQAFALDGKPKQKVFVILDPSTWLNATELESAQADNGLIEISNASNETLFTGFKAALEQNIQLVVDENDDGKPNPEELKNPVGDGGLVPR